MSFDDHLSARPTNQQTARNPPEQIEGARAACVRYALDHEGGDPEAVRDLFDKLNLWPTPAEIAAAQREEGAS